MKLELGTFKENSSVINHQNTEAFSNMEIRNEVMEKENRILHLELQIKTLEGIIKETEGRFKTNLTDMETNFNEERNKLQEELSICKNEKDEKDQELKAQEKLMVNVMASFFFDTLTKQELKRKEDNNSQESILKKLRNSSYGFSSKLA